MNVDADMTQLAKMMRDRQAAGGAPYVLLLGSSLSLTPEVRRAVCGSDDWGIFWTAVEKMSLAERRAAFKGPLERLLLAEGYRALTRLLAAGYFEVVFTLNVDDALDNALRALKADQRGIWIYGEVDSAELVAALEYRSPRVKVLKLRGDINKHKLPLTPAGQFEFPPNLEHAVRQWLSHDTTVVGDLPFDDDVWRCLRGGDGALWVVGLETSERLRRVKQVRQKGEVITAESFNAFFTALADALEVEEVKPARELPPQNPYQGLEAFTQDRAQFFFGRERLTEKLLERLRRERFLAVIGASGSGKSSVVQAGLLHRLARGALPGSADWPTLVCRPGELVDALARLLRETPDISADEQQDLLARVPADETVIHVIAERVLQDAPPGHRLVLVVDQFEELFTLESAEYREKVIAALLYAVRAAGGRTTVVVTMRSDFYTRVAEYDELFVWMEQHREFVPPMGEIELRDAIQRPARLVKFPLDDALANTILRDAGRELGALPLLQYALKELYDRWQGGLTPAQAYGKIGGVQGALEHRADEVYRDLSDRQQTVARHILIRLTRLGEGTEDTRRRMTFENLVTSTITLAEIEEVVDILTAAQNRLLVTDDPDKERPGHTRVVEVAHEALIRGWGQLRTWLNEDRAGLLLRQRLGEDAWKWANAGRHEDYLYRGLELGKAREWAEVHEGQLNELEQAFLDVSVEVEEREAAEKEAQRQRELEATRKLAEQAEARRKAEEKARYEAEQRAEERANTARRLRQWAIVVAVVAVLAVAAAAIAVAQWRLARTQAQVSLSRQLAAQAYNHFDDQFDLALLLSLAANHIADTVEAKGSLLDGLEHTPRPTAFLRAHDDNVWSVAFSPDGKMLASGSEDNTIILWDIATGQPIALLDGHTGRVWSVAFSPDGKILTSGSEDTTIILWDVATHQQLSQLTDHRSAIYSVAFSPNGKILASGSKDGSILLWDVKTSTLINRFFPRDGYLDSVNSVAFSPDGRVLASGCQDTTIILWNVEGGQPIGAPLAGHEGGVESVIFSPDGHLLASASEDKNVILWDVTTHALLDRFTGHEDEVLSVAFSPDSQVLASGSKDNTIILWDVATGQRLYQLAGHTAQVSNLAFNPDGKTLASGSRDSTIILWDITGVITATPQTSLGQVLLPKYTDEVWSIALSPDGRTLASGGIDGTVVLWNIETRQQLGQLTGHTSGVRSLSFRPDGRTLASVGVDSTMILWDVANLKKLDKLTGHTDQIRSLAFSPDGQMLALGSDDITTPTIVLWDMNSDKEISQLAGHTDRVDSVVFSPNGSMLASASCGKRDHNRFCIQDEIILWDIASGRPLGLPTNHIGEVNSLAFSPNGKILASGSRDETIVLWDVEKHQADLHLRSHNGCVNGISFSLDGQRLASGNEDGTIILWDVATGKPIGRPLTGHNAKPVNVVTFSPVSQLLFSGGDDGAVILWSLSFQAWVDRACSIASRNLTQAEWNSYIGTNIPHVFMGTNIPYVRTCHNLPSGAGAPPDAPEAWTQGRDP
jgi:WD40 repeat protein